MLKRMWSLKMVSFVLLNLVTSPVIAGEIINSNEIQNYIINFRAVSDGKGRIQFLGMTTPECAKSLKVTLNNTSDGYTYDHNVPKHDYAGTTYILKMENTEPSACSTADGDLCTYHKNNPNTPCVAISETWKDREIIQVAADSNATVQFMSMTRRISHAEAPKPEAPVAPIAPAEEQHELNLDLCQKASQQYDEDAIKVLTGLGILDEETIEDLKLKAKEQKIIAQLKIFEERVKNISLTSTSFDKIEKLIDEIEDYAYDFDEEENEDLKIKASELLVKLSKRLLKVKGSLIGDDDEDSDDDDSRKRSARRRVHKKAVDLATMALSAAKRLDPDNVEAQGWLAERAHKRAVAASKALNHANFEKNEYKAMQALNRLGNYIARSGNDDSDLNRIYNNLNNALARSEMARPTNALVPFFGKFNPRDGKSYGTEYRKLYQTTVEAEFNRYYGVAATGAGTSINNNGLVDPYFTGYAGIYNDRIPTSINGSVNGPKF